ncbi:MAG TPA: hypothetical protein VLA04_01765 [Verrucomicrobiae bacterium]|nr:hypothetical protein [Verrucomicrobiae bacterium]
MANRNESRGRGNFGNRQQHVEAGRLGGLARARNNASKASSQRNIAQESRRRMSEGGNEGGSR